MADEASLNEFTLNQTKQFVNVTVISETTQNASIRLPSDFWQHGERVARRIRKRESEQNERRKNDAPGLGCVEMRQWRLLLRRRRRRRMAGAAAGGWLDATLYFIYIYKRIHIFKSLTTYHIETLCVAQTPNGKKDARTLLLLLYYVEGGRGDGKLLLVIFRWNVVRGELLLPRVSF